MKVGLPQSMAGVIEGYRRSRVSAGESGGTVLRLEADGAPTLYLKYGSGRIAADIHDEAARLAWLAGRLTVPAIEQFVATADTAWLLTHALSGCSGDALLADDIGRLPTLAVAAASFLKRIHALPVADCPFEAGHGHRLAAARRNIDAGVVDEEDFDADHAGWSAENIWDELIGLLPFDTERVVTHGDYSLGNLMFADGVVTGCLDVGRVGLADPYQDIAILWQNLGEFGADAQAMFAAALDCDLDEHRLRFHRCLDELF